MEKGDLIALQKKVTALRADGKYKETIINCYQLLQFGMDLDDSKSKLVAYINLAASFYCIGNMEEAFHSIKAYDQICRDSGDDEDYLQLYNVSFLLYEFIKDYSKAKETLMRSIALGKKLKKYNIVSNGYSNYSHVCLKEGNFSEALEMSQTGLDMAKLHIPAIPILEFRVMLNMAQSYIELGDFKNAETLISKMEMTLDLDSFIREKSQFYILKSSLLTKKESYQEAYVYLTQAKEQVEMYQDLYLLKDIQEERIKLCELMEDFLTGFKVQKEYIQLLNEINKNELSMTALQLDVKHSLSEMKKLADTDYLTGLYNRKYLETTANIWLKEGAESRNNVVFIVLDIDHFKTINDQFGHLFGDEVISKVGHALSDIIEEGELFARYGGDEFVIVLNNSRLDEGERKAKQVEDVLAHLSIVRDGQTVPITCSIGVADNARGRISDFRSIFEKADSMLYQAKKNGRHQISVYGA